jgi:hypothetical protein
VGEAGRTRGRVHEDVHQGANVVVAMRVPVNRERARHSQPVLGWADRGGMLRPIGNYSIMKWSLDQARRNSQSASKTARALRLSSRQR